MKKAIVCIFSFLLFFEGWAQQPVLTIGKGKNNPRNSEGDFITLKNGRILYIYTHFTGDSYMDHAPAYLASRYSDDGGSTWSKNDRKVVENEGSNNVMSVSLLRLRNGEIALFYLRKNSLSDCMPMVRFSSDEGQTWSQPVSCIRDKVAYYILMNSRVIQLTDGRLLMPVYVKGKTMTYYSDDNARTWNAGGVVGNPDSVVNQEPGIVELKDGRLMMIMRTDVKPIYVSYSSDRGASWSNSAPGNIISATQSPATVVRIPKNGDLLLVWNNNIATEPDKKAKRTPLNAAISRDNGQTWEHVNTLESYMKGSYCYTAIHFVGDDVLLAYFDWLTLAVTIRKIHLNWFYTENK